MARLVLLALLGCSQPQRNAAARSLAPVSAVPITGWTADFSARCESQWLQPATHCARLVLDYDGCRWRCVAPPIEGARQ